MADQPWRVPRPLDANRTDPEELDSSETDTREATEVETRREIAELSLQKGHAKPTILVKPRLSDVRALPLGKPGERLAAALHSARPDVALDERTEDHESQAAMSGPGTGHTWHPFELEITRALEAIKPPGPLDLARDIAEGTLPKGSVPRTAVAALHDWSEDPWKVAHDVLEFGSPAGDVQAMKDGSHLAHDSALELNPWGVAAGMAIMVGGILGVFTPGSQYLKRGSKFVRKKLDRLIASWHDRNRLDVRDIATFNAKDFKKFGKQHGVPNLGGMRKPVTFAYEDFGTFQIPGGLDGTFSYYETLVLRASGIDASRIPEPIHIKLQQKLARTLMPKDATDVQIFNNYLFAMVTPNQSLVNSQVIMSVMRIRSPEDMEKLANMIDWNPGDAIVPQIRREASRRIAAEYGLQSKARGGLGVAGTIDYTRLAEFAQLFKKKPKAFRKRPDKVEDWIQFNDRVAGLVKGLGTKAASLGTGIQDPLRAGIAQVDRILARTEFKTLFKTDAAERVFEEDVITDWNKMVGPNSNRAVESLDELVTLKGGESFLDRRIARLLAAKKTPRFIDGPNGRIPNPNIPKHLKHPDDPITTDYVSTMSPAYNAALMARLRKAEQTGLSGFSFSWMSWDRARGSLEPHEHWFPGLEKLPKPHREQYELFLETQREAGRLNFSRRPEDAHLGRKGRQNTPRPYANPAAGAIPSLPPVLLFSIWAAHQNDPEKREAEANDGPRT